MIHRHINIFVSSTFRDMQAERDHLKKHVLPRLQEELLPYGITVNMTDLRWGIDTSEEDEVAREEKVLHVCLDAISRDRPYFIGLLGGRYGWIPAEDRVGRLVNALSDEDRGLLHDVSGKSVTEIEILFGALANSDVFRHSFFFFRNPDVYATIPEEYRKIYLDAEPRLVSKSESLKRKISEMCTSGGEADNLFHYGVSWDSGSNAISGLQDFGEKVYKALVSDILESNVSDSGVTSEEYEQNALEAFVIQRTNGFCGRQRVVQSITDFLLNFDPTGTGRANGYFLSGFSGCGKSSVFSKVYYDLTHRPENEKIVVLGHSAGLTAASVNPEKMLDRWIARLSDIAGETADATLDLKEKFARLNNLVMRLGSKGYRIVAMIDSYDSFRFDVFTNDEEQLKTLSFIPGYLPFVCTTLPGHVEEFVNASPAYRLVDMDMFSRDEAEELVNHALKVSVKELSPKILAALLDKRRDDGYPSHISPLWLRMALSILDEMGDEDFKAINNEPFERDDVKINSYLEHLIEGFASEPESLFRQYIGLSCSYFNADVVRTSLYASAITVTGVSEAELALLCEDSWDELEFSGFARWMREFFRQNPLTGRWTLGHAILKKVILSQDGDMLMQIRKKYASVLLSLGGSGDSMKELLSQTIELGDTALFADIMDSSDSDLGEYVVSLLDEGLSKDRLISFAGSFVSDYAMQFSPVEALLYNLVNDSLERHLGKDYMLGLVETCICSLPEESFRCNDCYLFSNYLFFQQERFCIRYMEHEYREAEAVHDDFLDVYMSNRTLYGTDFIPRHRIWQIFSIFSMYCKIPHSEYGSYYGERTEDFVAEGERRWLGCAGEMGVLFSIAGESERQRLTEGIKDELEDEYFYSDEFRSKMNGILGEYGMNLRFPECRPRVDWSEYYKEYDEKKRAEADEAASMNKEAVSVESSKKDLETFLQGYSVRTVEELDMLVSKYLNVANALRLEGRDDEALRELLAGADMALNHYISMPKTLYQKHLLDFYKASEQEIKALDRLAAWLFNAGHANRKIEFLEKAYRCSRLMLALYPVGEVLFFVNELRYSYSLSGYEDRELALLGEYFEFVSRHPMPESERFARIDDINCQEYLNLLRRKGLHEKADEVEYRMSHWPSAGIAVSEKVGQYLYVRKFSSGYTASGISGRARHNVKWGYADKSGKPITGHVFDEAGEFIDGLAVVGISDNDGRRTGYGSIGMKYGYLNADGQLQIPAIYEYASNFYKGEALVSHKGEIFYIDTCGCRTRDLETLLNAYGQSPLTES